MKETGILFTPENHHLILSGQKFQTRRVITPQPEWDAEVKHTNITGPFAWPIGGLGQQCGHPIFIDGRKDGFAGIRNPYGGVGDKLYVKEGVIVQAKGWSAFTGREDGSLIGYYMNGRRLENDWEKRLTAMFMAKRYARTWLEITDVRVEQVQGISEEDAKSEGPSLDGGPWIHGGKHETYRAAFFELWDSINRKKHPFSQNPWVWVLEFKQI